MSTKKYTHDQLIKILQDEYAATSVIPTTNTNRGIHHNTFLRYFGTWSNALTAADIPTRKPLPIETAVCSICNTTFQYKNDSHKKIFCSIQCSNQSRRGPNFKACTRTIAEHHEFIRSQSLHQTLTSPFDSLSFERKRKKILIEQNNKCLQCGLSEWQGQPLLIEIDHINGLNTDDRRSNMRGLCPNCHSLTNTFRGRNKTKTIVPDSQLLDALLNTPTIHAALLSIGMASKGGNYRRCKALLAKHRATMISSQINDDVQF